MIKEMSEPFRTRTVCLPEDMEIEMVLLSKFVTSLVDDLRDGKHRAALGVRFKELDLPLQFLWHEGIVRGQERHVFTARVVDVVVGRNRRPRIGRILK
jgi:hypothetical protein